jgi:pimeloyl-ACP methyl ester carboxylesterase
MTHMDLLGAPGRPLQAAALRVAEWLAGARFDDVKTTDLLRSVRCPVLVIAPGEDVFLGEEGSKAFEAALAARPAGAGPGELWRVEGASHLLGVHTAGDAYARRLEAFLAEALEGSPTTSPSTAEIANRT